jgi:antitoxin component of MazEF toxin-antitoxin module
MKYFHRLVKNGNSTQVTIPRRMMDHLRWRTGDPMVVELTERGTLEIRPPIVDDMRTATAPRMPGFALPESRA